jgi:hypothetical protein
MSAVSLIGAMTLVTLLVAVAVFYFNGTITPERIDDTVKVFRGELASPPEVAEGEEEEVSPGPIEIKKEEELKNLVANWSRERKAQEDELRSAGEAVEAARRELAIERLSVDKERQELAVRKAEFEEVVAARIASEKDAGFKMAVERFEKMDDPKIVGELLADYTDDEALRYLKAFKAGYSADVLKAIKKLDDAAQPGAEINRAARLQQLLSGEEIAFAGP